MEEILTLIATRSRLSTDPDRLEEWFTKNGSEDGFKTLCRSRFSRVDWLKALQIIEAQAKQVVESAEARALKAGTQARMDSFTRDQVMQVAKREALFRLIQDATASSEQKTQHSRAPIASPFSESARFNQISADTLRDFMVKGAAIQRGYVSRDWLALVKRDIQRLERNHLIGSAKPIHGLDLSKDALRLPAVYSVIELLATLPGELNLKAETRFCELQNESSFASYSGLPSGERKSNLLMGFLVTTARQPNGSNLTVQLGTDKLQTVKEGDLLLLSLKATPTLTWQSAYFVGAISEVATD
jgi:hypothetical protein